MSQDWKEAEMSRIHAQAPSSPNCNKGVRRKTAEELGSGKCLQSWACISKTHNGTHRCDLVAGHAGNCRCSCGYEKKDPPK